MISASSLDRLEKCPPSAVLGPRFEETGHAAEIGNHIHEFLRRIAGAPSEYAAALECVPDDLKERCKNIQLKSVLGDLNVVGCEEAYVVDAATGHVVYVGRNLHRAYNAAMQKLCGRDLLPTEVPTTLDVEALRVDGIPVAVDWKSGLKTAPTSELLQMWMQAFALAVKYESPAVEVRVCYIDDEGKVDIDAYEFNRMELDDLPQRLTRIFDAVTDARMAIESGAVPTVYPGTHCKYCNARSSCPAQTAMIKAMITGTDEEAKALLALTPAQVGEAYGKLQLIEKHAERIRDTLRMLIESNGGEVPCGNGYVYRISPGGKSYIPADLARGAIYKLGGTKEDIDAITKRSKFAVIRRVKAK